MGYDYYGYYNVYAGVLQDEHVAAVVFEETTVSEINSFDVSNVQPYVLQHTKNFELDAESIKRLVLTSKAVKNIKYIRTFRSTGDTPRYRTHYVYSLDGAVQCDTTIPDAAELLFEFTVDQ